MDKYLIKHKIRFTNKDGITQVGEVDDIISFEEGDDVNTDSLVKLGAIEKYREPKKPKAVKDEPALTEEDEDGSNTW